MAHTTTLYTALLLLTVVSYFTDNVVAVQYLRTDEPPIDIPLGESPSSLIAAQFTTDPYSSHDHMDMILKGELNLAGLRFHPTSFASITNDGSEDDDYNNVYGEFCVFDAQLNKKDPSYYPTNKDIMAESNHCGEHRYTIPLNEVMDAIKNNKENSDVKTLPVSGMLFHQGYSGAGVIANTVTAFGSTHLVSEHTGECHIFLIDLY